MAETIIYRLQNHFRLMSKRRLITGFTIQCCKIGGMDSHKSAIDDSQSTIINASVVLGISFRHELNLFVENVKDQPQL